MNLFNKFLGKCFTGISNTKTLNPTLGLPIHLAKNATGNAVTRRMPIRTRPFSTVNKSRAMRYDR